MNSVIAKPLFLLVTISLLFPFSTFAQRDSRRDSQQGSQSVAPVANPTFPHSCGLDVALVIDSSGSINDQELAQMKAALHQFVNTFLPATPTQFSVVDFDSTAHILRPFTTNIATINTAIDAPTSGGSTNWQDALVKAQSTFDPRASTPNLIIFASDGEPNVSGTKGDRNGNDSQASALAAAVEVANAIKSTGTRIMTIGIGTGGSATFIQNLEQISGQNVNTGATSDLITSNFSTFAADLAAIAQQQCGGTISVTKITDRDGNLGTTGDQSIASGWNFNVAGYTHQTGEVGGDTGKTAPQDVTGTAPVSVGEITRPDFNFISAHCSNVNHDNALVGVSNSNGSVTGITLNDGDIISCIFYNEGPNNIANCPTGFHLDLLSGKCVVNASTICISGTHLDTVTNQCVPDTICRPTCPIGYQVQNNRCVFVGCPATGCRI